MSQFPNQLDTDTDLPRVDNNITDIGAEAINATRSAIFAIEGNIGTNAQGAALSIADRLNTSLDPLGRILPSALVGLGLVYLPITDAEVSPTAGIQESKLNLIYPTPVLYNLYQNLRNSIDVLNGFLSLVGVKLEPHIDGTAYNHDLSAIFVDAALQMLKTLPGAGIALPGTSVQNRDTLNADTLIKDISDDLLTHETANGLYPLTVGSTGTVPPQGYAHVATGLWIDTSSFAVIPQSASNLQAFADFCDSSSLLLIGSRTQNLFSNGISVAARASSLTADGYGQSIVPATPVIAYLLNVPPGPMATSPVDDINHGDDVVLFQPTAAQLSSFNIDAQFAQVQAGDLITINYGNGITLQFTVDSVKAIVSGTTRVYAVRLNGKNPYSASNGMARIDRPLYTTNKYGVLATARVPNNLGILESLIIAHPRAAMVLGNGFNASEFDSSHYNLYLTLFPNGDPTAPLSMPAIDLTGNKGISPGQYTLDTIVNNANAAFRAPGFNLRFIAFEYQGQFGIMLAESYNNAAFSVVAGTVNNLGQYTSSSNSSYPGNVVDNYGTGLYSIDPLGFGQNGANVASPPPGTYGSVSAAQFAPSLLFYPKRSMYYYVNGVETDLLRSDPLAINQIEDGYGDGYWPATILPAPASMVLPNRVQATYQVNLDLSTSGLKAGKTIVVQPAFPVSDARYNFRDYGRFVIQSVSFSGCDTSNPITNIVVYDAVHANGSTPGATSTNIPVLIYFSDDSVAFDTENVSDQSSAGLPYTRWFEIYVSSTQHTWTHERARFSVPATGIANFSFYKVSPKLAGYPTQIATGEFGKAIQLTINSYNSTTGLYQGQLVNPNAPSTNFGPLTVGKQGNVVRFYDETNVDYIDFLLPATSSVASWSSPLSVVIQLYPSLELDQEAFLLSGCQVSDVTGQVSNIVDLRQFGNTSELNFTTSALDYIAAPTRLLQANGIVRGFDYISQNGSQVQFDGGEAVVNGNIVQLNPQTVEIPAIFEAINASIGNSVPVITWFVCVNTEGELQLIASTDFDPNGPYAAQYSGLDNTRRFYGMNPNLASPVAYPIRGTYFNDLVLNNNDLTPIAVAVATTTLSGTTYSVTALTVSDARRFVYGGFGGMADAFVLSPNGSFRSLAAVNTWLTQLNNYESALSDNGTGNGVGNRVIVKGVIPISSSVTLSYLSPVTFIGDGGIFSISSARGLVLGSGVHFDGVRFDYTHTPTIGEGYSTTNLVNSFNAAIYGLLSTSTAQDIEIKNCIFNSFAADHYPFVSFEFSGTVNYDVLQNVVIDNCKFVDNAGVQDLRAAIVFNSITNNQSGGFPYFPKLTNCTISNNKCNNDQMILITAARSGVTAANLPISCTNVRITGNTCGTIGFLTTNDIPGAQDNSVYGVIRDKNDSLFIGNNTCKFIANIDGNGQYLASSTLCTYAPGLGHSLDPSKPFEPATFIVTNASNTSPIQITVTTPNPSAFSTGLHVTVQGVTGNTNANVYNNAITFISSTVNSATFSLNGVNGNAPYGGGGFTYVSFNTVPDGTGSYTISNNTCSWIHVSDAGSGGSGGGIISQNTLSPFNPAFLQNYADTFCSVAPVNAAIILHPCANIATLEQIWIINNNIGTKSDYLASIVTYTYDQGIISIGNGNVEYNSISNCMTSSSTFTGMITISLNPVSGMAPNNATGVSVKNNALNRGSSSIRHYIDALWFSISNPGSFLYGITAFYVTNNTFDSWYVDASDTVFNDMNLTGITVSNSIISRQGLKDRSVYSYNFNQICYQAIPFYRMFTQSTAGGVTGPFSGTGTELLDGFFPVPNTENYISWNCGLSFSDTSAGSYWAGVLEVDPWIPAGATLLNASLGVCGDSLFNNFILGSAEGLFSLAIVKQQTAQYLTSAIANTLVDVFGYDNAAVFSAIIYQPVSGRFAINSSTALNNFNAFTQVLELNLVNQDFTVGKGFPLSFVLEVSNLQVSVSTPASTADFSPIVVRYTF
jgi:hypothetical protein